MSSWKMVMSVGVWPELDVNSRTIALATGRRDDSREPSSHDQELQTGRAGGRRVDRPGVPRAVPRAERPDRLRVPRAVSRRAGARPGPDGPAAADHGGAVPPVHRVLPRT